MQEQDIDVQLPVIDIAIDSHTIPFDYTDDEEIAQFIKENQDIVSVLDQSYSSVVDRRTLYYRLRNRLKRWNVMTDSFINGARENQILALSIHLEQQIQKTATTLREGDYSSIKQRFDSLIRRADDEELVRMAQCIQLRRKS